MCSCNDVIAIFLFNVLCGVVFSSGNLTHQLLQGPVGIVMGCVYGALAGLLVLNLPSRDAVFIWFRRELFALLHLHEDIFISASIFAENLSLFLPFFIFPRNILMGCASRRLFSAGRCQWWGANISSIHRRALWDASQLRLQREQDGGDERQRMRRLRVMWSCT